MLGNQKRYAIGIDVGGTKVEAACVTQNGDILWNYKEPVVGDSRQGFIEQIARIYHDAKHTLRFRTCLGLGLAIPAVLSKDREVIMLAPNLPVLNGASLVSELLKKTAALGSPITPVLGFDGTASMVAENWLGKAHNTKDAVTVMIGTGIGCGLKCHGRIVTGYNNVCGAFGWMRLGTAEDTRTLEEVCGGLGVTQQAQEKLSNLAVTDRTAKTVFDLAAQGDPVALKIVEEVITHLGVGLANLVSVLNPEVVIFGGSVGLRLQPYIPQLTDVIRKRAQPIAGHSVKLTCSSLANKTGVLGAAGLVLHESPYL